LEIIEPLARFIIKIFKLFIADPLDKIEGFLIDLKRKIRTELRSEVSRWVIVCIICALLVGYLTQLNSSFYENNNDNVQSYLSSISQGLAAFFALAFTISIFGAQTMGIFTALDKVMDKWTKAYIALFSVGIIFPIWQLITGIYSINLLSFLERKSITLPFIQIKISTTLPLLQLKISTYFFDLSSVGKIDFLAFDLTLAVFCVLGIIPFTIKINRIAKYEGGVSKLYSEAKDAINSRNEVVSSDNIVKLGELGCTALREALPHEVMDITTYIRNLGNLSIEKNLEESTIKAISELENLGLIAMNKKTNIGFYPIPWPIGHGHYMSMPEYPIAWNITNGLREICVGSIDKNYDKSIACVSCDILFNIGYMYFQKIRTTYEKTISRELRMILPNQLSLIEGDFSFRKTPTLVKMFLEIADTASKKKETLFCWNDFSGKDLEKLNDFFKKDIKYWYKATNYRKIDDGKTIMLYGGSTYSLELKEKNNQAILIRQPYDRRLTEDDCKDDTEYVKVLPIRRKDNKIYVCGFNYNETLEHSLIYLWILGAYILKNYPNWFAEDIPFQIRRSEKSKIRYIFESNYIQKEARFFIIANDRLRNQFKDLEDDLESFHDFYFGFEDYLKNKKD